MNLNSAQRNPRLGVCAAQKNPSLGLSLPRDVSSLGSASQVLASLCQDLGSGKSLNQACWALGVRYGLQLYDVSLKVLVLFIKFSWMRSQKIFEKNREQCTQPFLKSFSALPCKSALSYFVRLSVETNKRQRVNNKKSTHFNVYERNILQWYCEHLAFIRKNTC